MVDKIWRYFWLPETKHVIAAMVVFALLSLWMVPTERRRVSSSVVLFVVCLVGQLFGAFLEALQFSNGAVFIHELFVIGSGLALFRLLAVFAFRIVLPRLGIVTVRIAEDIILMAVYAAFILARLHIVGLDPGSLLTTSAVITAVLAFSMQDTLGNLLAGVALQLDNSLHVGDWVRIDDITGKVAQIRWRQTTIRTRNGEMVVVPNSQLMRGRFLVFGRADIPNWPWRRWVWFNVTHDADPTLVIQKIEKTVGTAEIPNVARSPAPNCVLMEFGPGYARYALRYWMIDPQPDDPTDSAVRLHIHVALKRAGMRLAVPEQSVLVTDENDAYRQSVQRQEIERRTTDLRKVELFTVLNEDELKTLSASLIYAPFAAGDIIFNQGDEPHWLYLLVSGEAEMWVDFPDHPRQVFQSIKAGSTFGERGVLTGEKRPTTIFAKTDVLCYRLDPGTFEGIIRSRPEIATAVAEILTRREGELDAFKQQFANNQSSNGAAQPKIGVLDRIISFLGL
ncbi:MAG TPA: mechanosensitive ion channel family protein [Accumulibacter sp.]|nr:mechanosensitive ion channel family protein [Accumulibacter sp.]